ncbi:PKD domain-containing protein [Microbacterium arthrosphaerae]|uniref:PKD domain-containing protein n=1 Tax=Microbacterium arthrosphaerae TaxID=792652 RepID=UPI0035E6336C
MLAGLVSAVLAASAAIVPATAAHADAASFELPRALYGANEIVKIAQGTLTRDCDTFGTVSSIFIVPAGSVEQGDPLVDAGGGDPNVIESSAFGAYFADETIAATQPTGSLGAGTYDIVEDTCQNGVFDGSDTIRRDAFTVEIDLSIPALPNAEILAMKDAASGEAAQWKATAFAAGALFIVHQFLELKGAATPDPDNMGQFYINFYLTYVCSVPGLMPTIPDSPITPWCPTVGIQDVVKLQMDTVKAAVDKAAHYSAIAADPPDPDFAQPVGLAAIPQLASPTGAPLERALAASGEAPTRGAALADAYLAAMEKYQGAAAAGDPAGALLQARSMISYAQMLQAQLSEQTALVENIAATADANGKDVDTALAELGAAAERVAQDGFSAEETQALRNLGFTPEAVADMRRIFTDEISLDQPFGTLDALVAAQREADTAMTAAFAGIVSGMTPIVDQLTARLDAEGTASAPVLSAGGPYTAPIGEQVALAADCSGCASLEWDLDGDGAFDDAVGATATVAARAGTTLVGVRGTDAAGLASIDYAQVLGTDPGHAPVLTAVSPATGEPVRIRLGEQRTFSVQATDADGDALTVRWALDGVDLGTGSSMAVAPDPARTSQVYGLVATIDDGAGHTRAVRWTVLGTHPDADRDGWTANVDCDDKDATVSPGSPEVPGNGRDDDCDPSTTDEASGLAAAFSPLPDNGGSDVAKIPHGGAAAGSSSQQNANSAADKLLDLPANSLATPWVTAGGATTDQWAAADLGAAYLVDRVAIRADRARYRPADFAVSLSTAGPKTALRPVVAGELADKTGFQYFELSTPVVGRYVRLDAYTNRGATAIAVDDLVVITGQVGTPTVAFTDRSTGAVAWHWDFGDGATSSERHPTHVFAGPGRYPVTLTVTGADGATATTTLEQTVLEPLQAQMQTPAAMGEGTSEWFTDKTVPPSGTVVKRHWTWTPTQSTTTTSATASWGYPDNGPQTVSLTVTDSYNRTATTTQTVDVQNVAPTVDAGAAASVTALDSWAPWPTVRDKGSVDNAQLTCEWDYGDGTTAVLQPCTTENARTPHAYTAPGEYTATLTATDKDGAVTADTVKITVATRTSHIEAYPVAGSAYGGAVTVRAQLWDRPSFRPMAGTAVVVDVAGVEHPATTDAHGRIELRLPPNGASAIEVSYPGDVSRTGTTATATLSRAGKPAADVVFLFDESGSMDPYQQAVRDNVRAIGDRLAASVDAQLGVIGFGSSPQYRPHLHVPVTHDLARFETALGELDTNGTYEPGIDAIVAAVQPDVGLRPEAGTCVVLIGDEGTQWDQKVPADARAALAASRATLFSIIKPGDGTRDYADLATGSGGAVFDIRTFGADPQPVLDAILDSCVATVSNRPDLAVTIDDRRDEVLAGDEVTYAVEAVNTGDADASGVVVEAELPAGAVLREADGADVDGDVVRWTVGALPSGSSFQGSLRVRVGPDGVTPGDFAVRASVRDDGSYGADPTPADTEAVDTDTVVELPVVTVEPVIVNDAGGELAADDVRFVLTPASQLPLADLSRVAPVADVVLEAGVATPVEPGVYVLLAEGVPDGYDIELTDACSPGGGIELAYGDVLECAVTIDDVAPTLRVTVAGPDGAPMPEVSLDEVVIDAGVELPITAGWHRLAVAAVKGFEVRFDGACASDGRFEAALGAAVECGVVLTAATPDPTPTGTPTPTPTGSPDPTPTGAPVGGPASAPGGAGSAGQAPAEWLAATGAPVAATLLAGLVVLAAGAVLLGLRRRRAD